MNRPFTAWNQEISRLPLYGKPVGDPWIKTGDGIANDEICKTPAMYIRVSWPGNFFGHIMPTAMQHPVVCGHMSRLGGLPRLL
ncbi:hypothetical protein [Laribacter hongkongensis]|uniref:Uncharacterized protein n=1 Tax=Laribacter hongkongensis TaxID=168471 RepID=A0A248LP61_9NEIS|nr:hypothetical protein [Laribacter hongkongensis]ASJ26325.1 hypothetical protein LHGZ1_3494 [Laribacter hongkongensis]MCG9042123.1 hypothetical protein [Laribacter hongkongensis]MCG9068533.1 hypothetical protein [Laribacter hongkongensis]MCG9088051.1 hypothetical protein [Laribacter hongkongensis]MCG9110613.1 hypothetical protein [Laribacter hongkongensis]